MTPKVDFRYSWVYDEKFKKKTADYPSEKTILNYINKVKKLWAIHESKILNELSKISGLKWKEKKIVCYIISRGYPFSDPLTIPIFERYPLWFIDTLTHELIHQLFIQKGNEERAKKSWNFFYKKYKKESRTTRIHIPLHAIHSHIYLKFFDRKRLEKDIKIMSRHKDYKRSWGIVKKEGYQNIINEFKNRLK